MNEQTNNEQTSALVTAIGGAVAIRQPFGGEPLTLDRIQDAIRAIYERAKEREAQVAALPDYAPVSALKEMYKALKEDDAAARDYPGAFADECAEALGLKPLFVQLECRAGRSFDPNCIRGRFKAMMDALDARIKAATPPAPRHTYVVQVELTDADMKSICRALDKCGAHYRYAAPQTDAAAKAIDSWFAKNA